MTEKNSFGPKCHGCVFFCSDSQELKEHLAAEKQIAAARADEVAMAAIHADLQILKEHLDVC